MKSELNAISIRKQTANGNLTFHLHNYRDNVKGTYHFTEQVLKESGFHSVSHEDILIVQYVAAIVSQRAALLVSITTAVLIRRMSSNDVTVAIDGSVYKHHPRMDGWLNRIIKALIPEEKIVSTIQL